MFVAHDLIPRLVTGHVRLWSMVGEQSWLGEITFQLPLAGRAMDTEPLLPMATRGDSKGVGVVVGPRVRSNPAGFNRTPVEIVPVRNRNSRSSP